MDSLAKRRPKAGNNRAGDDSFWEAAGSEEDLELSPWHLFDHLFLSPRPVFSLSGKIWNPPVNVCETPERIVIRMEIAGVCPSDLSVTYEEGILTIRGRRYERAPEEHESFHLMEIHHGCFERSFRLTSAVVEDKITAHYHDGFLDVEIPKGEPKGSTVKIKIREM